MNKTYKVSAEGLVKKKDIDAPIQNSSFITCIGASAGGIQALQQFFTHVPQDSGIVYVVILHLSPDHDSRLAEVLQSTTLMSVTQVNKKVQVEPNHVYVVPPNQHLTMEDGHIIVSPNTLIEERRAPVDIFFRTLAEHYAQNAVAVILSGTGANGSMGLKRVKEKGGAVFVQNPREAEYSDMPRNAIATELVDEILNVAEIPAKVIAYKNRIWAVTIPVPQDALEEDQQAALREIFTQLRTKTGHDFSNYKRATMLRRIERRISVHGLNSLAAYVDFMRKQPEETQALLKDVLISVTNFFRDKDSFTYLETVTIPKIIQHKIPGKPVRIWTAGCATGEEAYSIAMLLAERFDGLKGMPPVQVFATDIDEDAILKAREGFYTLNDAADISAARLQRFFNTEAGGYRVKRELREMILFANHNVIKDPPFSHLDLVTCRNMLIYLNQAAQNRVMETFHFALNPGGYLFLGSSESIDGANDLYLIDSKEYQVFQSRQVTARPFPVPDNSFVSSFKIKLPGTDGITVKGSHEQENRAMERISLGDLHQRLLEQYAPPSIIINENYDVVHVSENAGRFMRMPGGEPSKSILKLVRNELRLELRTALYQARQKQVNIEVKNLPVKTNEHVEIINLHVRPVLRANDTARGFILVVFEPSQNKPGTDAIEIFPKESEPVSLQLEEELNNLKIQARSSGEQFEVQTEELKASNEELQAMNEELRSAAEELETSKEELQSINEELITVNQELKVKIEEVSQSNNDFQNLINSTDIGTIFLDRYFRIKLFTPASREIFNLIPADLGRPLSDITNRLDYPNLLQDVEGVLKKLQSIEREVRVQQNRTYLMQVTPYRTAEDRISGVVIAFINISELKNAENSLRTSEAQLESELRKMRNLYDSSTRVLAIQNVQEALNETLSASMHLIEADFGCIQLYDATGDSLKMVAQSGFSDEFEETFKQVNVNYEQVPGRSIKLRKRVMVKDVYADKAYKAYKHYAVTEGYRSIQSTPLFGHDDDLLGILSTFFKSPHIPSEQDLWTLDLYARQASAFIGRTKAEEALRKSEERLRITMESAVDYAIINTDINGLIEGWNSGAEHTFEFTADEVIGKPGDIIFTDEDKAAGIPGKEMKTAREEGRAIDERWHRRKDGSNIFLSGTMRPIYNPELTGYVKVARDMTKQKLLEQQKDDFIAIASHELRTPVTSIKAYTELLRDINDEKSNSTENEMIAKLDEQVDRLVELIRSLLDTTTLSQGEFALLTERFDLTELVKERVEELKHIAADHTFKLLAKDNIFITADRRRIGEVLTNLISNAVKYSPKGGDIIIALEKTTAGVQVSVHDTGIGIPEDVKTKIFGRFYRVNNAQASTFPGMGLGLYIAASIITLHKGKIWVESNSNDGSTFYFSLPYNVEN
ncbi:MAG: CheR family methyltransferase [Parafilimonas sp.]